LASFYQEVFGCTPVPPERHLAGPELEAGMGLSGARVSGIYLRLPGWGDAGPTLEIFQYGELGPDLPRAVNGPGSTVRQAAEADAPAATEVLRRSISTLCIADHHNDPIRLESWLRNKTVSNVAAWIVSARNYCVVASLDEVVCGFGAMTLKGEIMLCYVDPAVRFRGVSSAMLDALECKARLLGLAEVHLDATVTARRFYEERGYIEVGCTKQAFETISCQSMAKRLAL
jgi:GNAT superfamily N-acetyltransferase